jgi:SAM-dependent methyltransferase
MYESKCWHEQDEFWDTVEPVLFTERRMVNAPVEVEKMIALMDMSPGQRVLDLCCGVGRHTLEFARRGYQVVGVDRTQLYLDRAIKQAREEALDVQFVQSDMREYSLTESFDVVLNYFTSFGFFDEPKDDTKVVTNAYRSLKTGGLLLLDLVGKEVIARTFRERDWREEGGIIILEERSITANWSLVQNRWIVIKGDIRKELELTLRLYSAVELTILLRNCGFGDVDVYGDIDGNPYDDKAQRLVVLARK